MPHKGFLANFKWTERGNLMYRFPWKKQQ